MRKVSLDGLLTVDVLSGVAAFSSFHFHRQFSALFGISIHRHVQLNRLKRAVYRLAFRAEHSITEIAYDSGYETPESFSRAFKLWIGQSPSEFRDRSDWPSWHTAYVACNTTRKSLHDDEFLRSPGQDRGFSCNKDCRTSTLR